MDHFFACQDVEIQARKVERLPLDFSSEVRCLQVAYARHVWRCPDVLVVRIFLLRDHVGDLRFLREDLADVSVDASALSFELRFGHLKGLKMVTGHPYSRVVDVGFFYDASFNALAHLLAGYLTALPGLDSAVVQAALLVSQRAVVEMGSRHTFLAVEGSLVLDLVWFKDAIFDTRRFL